MIYKLVTIIIEQELLYNTQSIDEVIYLIVAIHCVIMMEGAQGRVCKMKEVVLCQN